MMRLLKNFIVELTLPILLTAQSRVGFSFSQSLVDDWKQGKAIVFELNHSFAFKKDFRIDTLIFTPNFRYAIGVQYTNLTAQKLNYIVPTDNEIFAEGLLKYPAGWVVDPFVSANFRTQMTESFTVVKGDRRPTAKFWDPVVSMESFGFAHTLSDSERRRILTNRLGISLKQIRAENYTTMTDDPRTKERERWKSEAGVEWKSETTVRIENNVRLSTTNEIFASLKKLKDSTFRNSTELQVSLWKSLGLVLKLDLMYDQRQKTGMQYRQSMRLGFNWEI
ncbi:MAG: DUF3078 domain-containing protein [Candidatus Kapaibacteriota bacterium]